MKKCLIFLEEGYEKYSIDLIDVANRMYEEGKIVIAFSVGADTIKCLGIFDLVVKTTTKIENYDVSAIANAMREYIEKNEVDSCLIPATYIGRMLAPRLAMGLSTGLVADVTEIGKSDGGLLMVRPAFSGKIMAGIENTKTKPIMMSIRPGVFSYDDRPKLCTSVEEFTPANARKSKICRVSRTVKTESKDIRESSVLVSGGGGVMNSMDTVERLAELLHGMKSASRKTVDSGKADRSIQVGQSGKVVHPDLYIAAGIYGSIQHIAGLNKIKHLIAINTDAKAPICSLADIVVEGDAKDFMEKLIKKIEDN